MAWTYLLIAGVMECVWAVGLKFTDGFTRVWPTIWTLTAMAFSVVFLARAMKVIPIGTAYAVWTGIGAVGVAAFGMLFLGEVRSLARVLCIALIVAGIVGLKLLAAPAAAD